MTDKDLRVHWNGVYAKTPIQKLGWYEADPEPSLNLIKRCDLGKDARILNVGTGASTLIDELIKEGYENIYANDLSSSALEKLKYRLGDLQSNVKWIVDDLTQATKLTKLDEIDLWHDRAVLHFFNNESEQNSYFELVKALVKKNGFVIIAAFNLEGASKCSGLPVIRYNKEILHSKLGNDFELIEAFDHTYIMPSGDTREYVYTVFLRKQ